jgi:hypothetical protein
VNKVQAAVIIMLLTTNYFSYFHHQKFVAFINGLWFQIKELYYRFVGEFLSFTKWISSQDYDFSFNNREIALGVIFLVSVSVMFLKRDIRKSIINLFGSLFNKHFNRVYFEIFLYSLIMVSILYGIGFWNFSYTKDTLLWMLFTSLYLSIKVADDKDNNKLFLNILRNTISVTVFIEFLLNIYTFSIIVEIVVIVIVIFLSMMISFTEVFPDKDKNGQVSKLMKGINTYIGLNIFIFLILEVLNNLDSLLTLDTLKSFILPIIFTVMFIPYLYYLLIRVSYEQLNVSIRLNKATNRKIKLYFRVKMYLKCRFSRKKIVDLKRTKNHLIRNMKTKEDVDNIFMRFP